MHDFEKLLFCDLETFCETPIKAGSHKYAEDAEILLFPYAIGSGEPKVLDFTEPGFKFEDTELCKALKDPNVMTVWQNGSMFDRAILRHALDYELPSRRLHDTMVQALMHGLPGGLDILCQIFKLDDDIAKNKEGKRLIQLFCKPRPKNHKLDRATRETHPDDWEDFKGYAASDITAMRELYKLMPKWNMKLKDEMDLYHLDQKINNRGFAVDLDLARAAIAAADSAKAELNEKVYWSTGGRVESATQRANLLEYINDKMKHDAMADTLPADASPEEIDNVVRMMPAHAGFLAKQIPNLQAATIERFCEDPDLDPEIKMLLQARRLVGGTAVAKYKVLLSSTSLDGRLRGTLQFCGANRTGRWSGRVFQPQNLPRPNMMQPEIDFGIEALKAGCADLVVDNLVDLATSAVRGCIIAPEGKKLVVSDLSNIEGRVAVWLAGEPWKLEAFTAYDTITGYNEKGKAIRKGHDLYALSYARSFGITPEEVMTNKNEGDGSMRQVGKVQELALGYEGGVGAFVTFADMFRIDLDDLADKAYHTIPKEVLSEANRAWGWAVTKKHTQSLSKRAYVTCDSLKRLWRLAHPAVSSYWGELEGAAISAVINPGKVFKARKLKFYCSGSWLRMVLPSGRCLVYASPSVKGGKLSYFGVNQFTRKWCKLGTYGGKLFENACQAVARDVMGYNMRAVDDAGYDIILSVHDELLTETPDTDDYNVGTLSDMLAANPPWAEGLPLSADGFESDRYKKD